MSASNKADFSLANNVWYFAEGTTRQGFDEWITIQNPGDTDARVTITFMMDDGYNLDKVIDVRGNTRYTLSVRDVIGSDRDVSTKVVSDIPVVVERPMYFVYEGEWAGGHCAIGATVTSTNWFFAEGCTGDTFEEFLCMQNPGALNADVHIEYMTSGDVNYFEDVEIPPLSRLTVKVEDTVPAGEDVSAELTSTRPIVAERPMYYNFHGAIAGGDNVVGVNNPQASWFFAEGYTSPRFWTYLCIQNPGDASATVRVYYLLTDGDVLFNEFA
ncbi:MAG: hypothetical protein KKF66_00830, partial [Actinobacteria bacterium]|nr:hypothetical protein [Actinomycetota bacterium]